MRILVLVAMTIAGSVHAQTLDWCHSGALETYTYRVQPPGQTWCTIQLQPDSEYGGELSTKCDGEAELNYGGDWRIEERHGQCDLTAWINSTQAIDDDALEGARWAQGVKDTGADPYAIADSIASVCAVLGQARGAYREGWPFVVLYYLRVTSDTDPLMERGLCTWINPDPLAPRWSRYSTVWANVQCVHRRTGQGIGGNVCWGEESEPLPLLEGVDYRAVLEAPIAPPGSGAYESEGIAQASIDGDILVNGAGFDTHPITLLPR